MARPVLLLLSAKLALNGCDRVFQVPGESFLAVLDGLFDHPEIEIVTCRQEGGAAMMAEAMEMRSSSSPNRPIIIRPSSMVIGTKEPTIKPVRTPRNSITTISTMTSVW